MCVCVCVLKTAATAGYFGIQMEDHSAGAAWMLSGRPGLPISNSPFSHYGHKAALNLKGIHSELRSYVKVEVALLGSPSLINLMVSEDLKQHLKTKEHEVLNLWLFEVNECYDSQVEKN